MAAAGGAQAFPVAAKADKVTAVGFDGKTNFRSLRGSQMLADPAGIRTGTSSPYDGPTGIRTDTSSPYDGPVGIRMGVSSLENYKKPNQRR